MITTKLCAGNELLAIIGENLKDVENELRKLSDRMEIIADNDDMASTIEQSRIIRRSQELKDIADLYSAVSNTINEECMKGFSIEDLFRSVRGMV